MLSILEAAFSDVNPDKSLPLHNRFHYENGEVRILKPVVVISDKSATGQTKSESDDVRRKVTTMRYAADSRKVKRNEHRETWFDLWHMQVDSQ